MLELDFYFNKIEKHEFCEFLFNQKFSIVPDINSEYPTLIEFTNLIDLLKNKPEFNMLYFLKHKDYTMFDLCLKTFVKEGKKYYYIAQRKGGPTIDFFEGRIFETNKIKSIVASSISYYTSYFTCDLTKEFKASEELKNQFIIIVNYIKSNSKKIKIGTRSYWVGLKTIDDLRKNSKLENIDSNEYHIQLGLNY